MRESQACFYLGDGEFELRPTLRSGPGPGEVEIGVAYVGICGTDLHILHGAMDHRIKIPQILGHEASGTVTALGEGVIDLALGERVAVRPVLPCGGCPTCLAGFENVCPRLRFLGIDGQGALQEHWVVPRQVIHQIGDAVPLEVGALIEPLAVACHDVRRSGLNSTDRVVVVGAGPIGLLIALTVGLKGGLPLIVDVNHQRLDMARAVGVDALHSADSEAIDQWVGDGVDIAFEVSGAAEGLRSAANWLRPRGRLVQVGIHAEPRAFDFFSVFWKELELVGARLYGHDDFEEAIGYAQAERLPLKSLITSVSSMEQTGRAISDLASGGHNVKSLIQVAAS